MKTPGIFRLFLLFSIFIILTSCPDTDPITLHGNLAGTITDASTGQPVSGATVELPSESIKTTTDSTGSYILRNITPGEYTITVSAFGYRSAELQVIVPELEIRIIDFTIEPKPEPGVLEEYLDFELEFDTLSFLLFNRSIGSMSFTIITNKPWMSTEPDQGSLSNETDSVSVTVIINRALLDSTNYIDSIKIDAEDEIIFLDIYINGLMDEDMNYYEVVNIGSQTWMAENLNTGTMISYTPGTAQTDNGKIEKYCYNNTKNNCDEYGGLYEWDELMNYEPDSIIRGICPVGWHIPFEAEWNVLLDNYNGRSYAGGALKDTGTLEEGTGLWHTPNEGATNESGFKALPAGYIYSTYREFFGLGNMAIFPKIFGVSDHLYINNNSISVTYNNLANDGISVRCIKDPP